MQSFIPTNKMQSCAVFCSLSSLVEFGRVSSSLVQSRLVSSSLVQSPPVVWFLMLIFSLYYGTFPVFKYPQTPFDIFCEMMSFSCALLNVFFLCFSGTFVNGSFLRARDLWIFHFTSVKIFAVFYLNWTDVRQRV